jgi:hypothetical protein
MSKLLTFTQPLHANPEHVVCRTMNLDKLILYPRMDQSGSYYNNAYIGYTCETTNAYKKGMGLLHLEPNNISCTYDNGT